MKPIKVAKAKRGVRKNPKYTLELTVKDETGKVIIGHRSEGDTCSYDERVKQHRFSPGSWDRPDKGITKQPLKQSLPSVVMFLDLKSGLFTPAKKRPS